MYDIIAQGLNQVLWTEQGKKEPKVSEKMLRHIIEKWHNPAFSVRYRLLLADTAAGRYAAECTITAHTQTPFETTRVGEVTPDERLSTPIQTVYDRAFFQAANDLLKLSVRERTDGETVQNAEAVHEVQDDDDEMSDDEVLLFGGLKGKTYGSVKTDPAFQHLLEQIAANGNISFNDTQKAEQYRKLFRLAKKEESL